MEQTNKPKSILKFNITTNLTAISFIAKKTNKVIKKLYKSKANRKLSFLDKKYEHIKPVTIGYIFPTEENSIQNLLNSCHTDIKTFIAQNEMLSVLSNSNGIVITTKNKFRVCISALNEYKKFVIITDKKRNILLKTESYSLLIKPKII